MTNELEAMPERIAEFLRMALPEGPFVLGAIPAAKGAPKVRTFDNAAEAAAWAAAMNAAGAHNLYWIHNRLKGPMDRKPKEVDVLEVLFLHVDCDPPKKPPREGMSPEELAEWTERERASIVGRLANFEPEPTFIVDSGGGFQAFWRLDAGHPVDGDETQIANLKPYNVRLRDVLGGDNCQSFDHLMRLPGTVNWPDAEKRKRGRKPRLSTVIRESGEAHPLHAFTPAAEAKANGAGVKVQISGNLPRLKDLDELPEAVSQRTRMLIVQGDDPDDPTKYGSKSEVMWAVTCEMIRAGCEDDIIAAVLLDPDFGISAHPLSQKRSTEYVARQIERAREEVIEPMLREINAKHFAVGSIGGKFRVASWRRSEIDAGRDLLEYQSVGDFANRYMHRRVQVGTSKEGQPSYAPAGKWWLHHPLRRQFEHVVFAPNEAVDALEEFNLWRGLAVNPAPGDWGLLRRLIWEALASADETYFDYIVRWLAFAVQQPERPAEVALVFRGGRGIGKSTIGHVMRRIFGQHGMNVTHPRHLHGNFNDHLHDCCFLFADEAVAPGDRDAEQMVKVMITEPTMLIEPKGLGKFMAKNRLHVIMASNERWVVPAGADERRFAVFDVSPHLAVPPSAGRDHGNALFWATLYGELDSGGIAAFLDHLLSIDLTDWHPRRQVPQTSGLLDQKVSSLRGFDRIVFEILASGELPNMPSNRDRGGDMAFVSTRELWQYARAAQVNGEAITETLVGMVLAKLGFHKVENGRPRGFVLPSLIDARTAWDEKMFRYNWGASRTWGLAPPRDKGVGPY